MARSSDIGVDLAVGRIRTFHGRHGRVTDRMVATLDDARSRRGLDARPDPARPLVLEVGCGRGEAAIGFAVAHPEVDVFAVDVHTPGVVTLIEAADEAGLDNVYAERADALHVLDERIPVAGLAGLHLFFPDPWPKSRHRKRRFVRADVLDLLAARMAPGAPLRLSTDVAEYARSALARLDEHPAFRGGVADRPPWRPITRYEAAARSAGRRVVDTVHHRR